MVTRFGVHFCVQLHNTCFVYFMTSKRASSLNVYFSVLPKLFKEDTREFELTPSVTNRAISLQINAPQFSFIIFNIVPNMNLQYHSTRREIRNRKEKKEKEKEKDRKDRKRKRKKEK